METCKSCKFFLSTQETQGLCRRYPPIPLLHIQGSITSVFPALLNDGWCGEYIPNDGEQE